MQSLTGKGLKCGRFFFDKQCFLTHLEITIYILYTAYWEDYKYTQYSTGF